MSWQTWVAVLVLTLPLLGAILALLGEQLRLGRAAFWPAALSFFLAAVGLLALVEWPATKGEPGLFLKASAPTPVALQVAPTSRWVQPPRTLHLPTPTPPLPTPTPIFTATATPTPHPLSLATVVVRNGTGQSGLATRTSERLRAQGFRVLPPEDDPQQGNRPHTLILDRGDHAPVRQALAAFLHVPPEQITINAAEESEADLILILGDDFEALSSATPTPTPALVEVPTPTPNPYAGVTIVIRNGTVGRPGLATRTADRLRALGFVILAVEDDDRAGSRPYTLILDRGDHARVRQALMEFLKVKKENIEINSKVRSTADIVVILGDDFRE